MVSASQLGKKKKKEKAPGYSIVQLWRPLLRVAHRPKPAKDVALSHEMIELALQ